jgi:hypothetical protein
LTIRNRSDSPFAAVGTLRVVIIANQLISRLLNESIWASSEA